MRSRRIVVALVAGAGCVTGTAGAATPDHATRIVGGSPAAAGAWPAQARITGSQGILASGCGGTLVSARFVLTAAHCVGGFTGGALAPSAFTVRLGSAQADSGGREHAVDAVVRHEGWTSSTAENDLALLHLAEPSTQEPMPLIGEDEAALWAEGVTATIIGWGLTSTGGSGSRDLLQAEVPMVGDVRCAEVWGGTFKPANQVCAGGGGDRDSCQGDSGGPLLVPRDGGWAAAGIVSYGTSRGCATEGVPSVYTRIGAPALNRWLRDRVPTLRLAASTPRPRAGSAVVLTVAASGPAAGVPGQTVWDLDGDGLFDDATGASVPAVFAAGPRTVRAALALPDGDRALSTVRLDVGAARRVPAGVRADGTVLPAVAAPFSAPAGGGARSGFACDVACSARSTLVVGAATARALGLRSRTIASGARTLTGPGIAEVALKVPAAVRRRLVGLRTLRAELRVTVRAGGRSSRLVRPVTGRATRRR
jgi:hypothetical protein